MPRNYLNQFWMIELSEEQMSNAPLLTLTKALDNTNGWDNVATIEGNGPLQQFNDVLYDNFVYSFYANEGATYDISSVSYYDPLVKLCDQNGNVIESDYDTTNNEGYEVNGVVNNVNTISKWVAPYTGIYYVDPGWQQGGFSEGNFEDSYVLSIDEDIDTITAEPMEAKAGRIFNWLEYSNGSPFHHTESHIISDYYARFYYTSGYLHEGNTYGLGEKDGNIYFYNSGVPDGTDPISLLGTVSDLLTQAMAEGF